MRGKFLVAAMAIALGIVSCAAPAPTATPTTGPIAAATPTKAPTATPTKVPVIKTTLTYSTQSLVFGLLFLAEKKGYFKEQALDATLSGVGTGPKALAAIASGDAEFAAISAEDAFSAVIAGRDVRIIAPIMLYYQSIVIRNDVARQKGLTSQTSTSDRIRALKGLTIGMNSVGGGHHRLLLFLFAKENIDPDRDVNLVATGGYPTSLAGLSKGTLDAFVSAAPAAEQAIIEFDSQLLFRATDYPPLANNLSTAQATPKEFLDRNMETAVRVTRAMDQAIQLLKSNPDDAKRALREVFPDITEPVFDLAWKNTLPVLPTDVEVTKEMIDKALDTMRVATGEAIPLTYEQVIDNRPAKEAKKR